MITAIGRIGGGRGLDINAPTVQITPGISLNKGDTFFSNITQTPLATLNTDIAAQGWNDISADGKYVAFISGMNTLIIYRNDDGVLTKLNTFAGVFWNCSFSADGTYLAAASGTTNEYSYVYKRTNDVYAQLPAGSFFPIRNVGQFSFSADGTYLAGVAVLGSLHLWLFKRTAGTDNFVKIWDFADRATDCCTISPDGRYIAFGDNPDPGVKLYYRDDSDGATNVAIPSYTPSSYLGYVNTFAFSSDSKMLAITHYQGSAAAGYILITFKINADKTTTEFSNNLSTRGVQSGVQSPVTASFGQNDKYILLSGASNQPILLKKKSGGYEACATLRAQNIRRATLSRNFKYYANSLQLAPFAVFGKMDNLFTKDNYLIDDTYIAAQACDGTNTIDAYALTE